MKAAETSASRAIADWTPLAVVCRSLMTAEIDTFISDVSTTRTNMAMASRSARRGFPFVLLLHPGFGSGAHLRCRPFVGVPGVVPGRGGDRGKCLVQARIEVGLVQGGVEPVAADQLLEAVAQLDEGDLGAGGVQFLVQGLEHLGRR